MSSTNFLKKIILLIIVFSFGRFIVAQINPNINWSAIGVESSGPIPKGALISEMDSLGRICIAGEVEENGKTVIRAAILQGSQTEILGLYIQDSIYASVETIAWGKNGDIFIGGTFQEAVNKDGSIVSVNSIVKWNSSIKKWESVGKGVGGNVAAIAVGANNDIYVGGGIYEGKNNNGSSVPLKYIGKWNNSQNIWEPVGGGLGGGVRDIEIDGGSIIVCGNFISAFNPANDTIIVNGIAAWNGSSWNAFGQGLSPLTNLNFSSPQLEIDKTGNVIVSGNIDAAVNSNSSTAAGPVVMWDGSQWISLTNNLVTAFPISGLSIDASGSIYLLHYASEQGQTKKVVSVLSGNTWKEIAKFSGLNQLYTITSNKKYNSPLLYAGGFFTEFDNPSTSTKITISNNAYWNGNIWQKVNGPGVSGVIYSLEIDNVQIPTKLYAGGSFSSILGMATNNIAFYDGENWQSLGNGVNGPVYAIKKTLYPFDGIFVGGTFNQAENPNGTIVNVDNIAFWNERTEEWQNVGGFDGPVYALEDFGAILIYAGGDFYKDKNGKVMNNIARFNFSSKTWQSLGGGINAANIPNPVVRTLKLNAPNYGRGYSYIHLFVGGHFSYAENQGGSLEACRNIILWDEVNDSWHKLGNGTDDEVLTLATPRNQIGDLWVGGRFRTAVNKNGTFVSNLPHAAIWNGFEWHKLANGLNGPVYTIDLQNSSSASRAFLGGDFTVAVNSDGTNITVNHIATFERTTYNGVVSGEWKNLGDGVDSIVQSIKSVWPCPNPDYEVLYTAGKFLKAGLKNTLGLAKWKALHPLMANSVSSVINISPSRRNNGQSSRSRAVVGVGSDNCFAGLGKSTIEEILLFDDLGFREKAQLPTLPYLQPFSLTIYDTDEPGQPIAIYDSLIKYSDGPQLLVLFGVDDTTAYAHNPNNISTIESVLLKEVVIDPNINNEPVLFIHGITDAPNIDIVNSVGDTLAVNLQYGTASSLLGLPKGDYSIDVFNSDNKQKLGSFSFTISNQDADYHVVAFSGFLNPAANQNGSAMGPDVFDISLDSTATSIKDVENKLKNFVLYPNYPNPFNPSTKIRYDIAEKSFVTLKIFDLLGREVAALVSEEKNAGKYSVQFNTTKLNGGRRGLSSGIYFYQLKAGDSFIDTKKFVFMK